MIGSASFGEIDDSGELQRSQEVIKRDRLGFGWYLEISSSTGQAIVKEVFSCPEASEWGERPPVNQKGLKLLSSTTSEDGMTQADEFLVDWDDAATVAERCGFTTGDPLGTYKFELFVDGDPFDEWEFRLVEE